MKNELWGRTGYFIRVVRSTIRLLFHETVSEKNSLKMFLCYVDL